MKMKNEHLEFIEEHDTDLRAVGVLNSSVGRSSGPAKRYLKRVGNKTKRRFYKGLIKGRLIPARTITSWDLD